MSIYRAQTGYASKTRTCGFSLAELLVAITIGSMVLVAVLTIYGRAEKAAAAVNRRLDESQLPGEILQRIAEDLDRMVSPGSGTKINVANRLDEGYAASKLEITRTMVDGDNKEQILEQIIWQSSYDIESATPGLVLYRSHNGISVEDKLFDRQRTEVEKLYPFVPICAGVTFFRVDIPQGDDYIDRWDNDSLPNGIRITISFAQPDRTPTGKLEVPEVDQLARIMALDRTRKIKFEISSTGNAGQQEPNTISPDSKTEALSGGPSVSGKISNVPTNTKKTR